LNLRVEKNLRIIQNYVPLHMSKKNSNNPNRVKIKKGLQVNL